MEFEANKSKLSLGNYMGYLLMFSVFTTILYFIISKKFLESWTYFNTIKISIVLVLTGKVIKYWLGKK